MRFHCDAMLGRLARDLRLLGYDASLAPSDATDTEVLAYARTERRTLLTRDRTFAQHAGPDTLLLEAEDGLAEVLQAFDLHPRSADMLTRCTECGERLVEANADDLSVAPPGTRKGARCAGCGHVYWEGTHVAAIRARLARYIE